MKKLLFIAALFSASSLFAQSKRLAVSDEAGLGFPCPNNYLTTIVFTLDKLNFHKPRTNCMSGFGFCLKFSFSLTCTEIVPKTSVSSNAVNAWIKLTSTNAELHVPLAIRNYSDFQSEKLSSFEVESNTISFVNAAGVKKWVKGGIYPVAKTSVDYVINLPLQ
jgi:hypothetical protein